MLLNHLQDSYSDVFATEANMYIHYDVCKTYLKAYATAAGPLFVSEFLGLCIKVDEQYTEWRSVVPGLPKGWRRMQTGF